MEGSFFIAGLPPCLRLFLFPLSPCRGLCSLILNPSSSVSHPHRYLRPPGLISSDPPSHPQSILATMAITSVLLVALSATSALAQNQNQITWGSVVFTYHGEKIPYLAQGSHHLTPLGAGQLQNAGTAVRERYLKIRENTTSTAAFHPINGLSISDIVNSQLNTWTLGDEVMAGSATAFMQGLYPPRNGWYGNRWEEYLYTLGYNGRGSLLTFPLDGYQYPAIKTLDTATDPDSILIAGHLSCDNYSISEVEYRRSSTFENRVISTLDFYQGLRKSVFSQLAPVATRIDFSAADRLYEYALYEYSHNSSIFSRSNFTYADLAELYTLASEQQFAINSPTAGPLGNISSIAGQALAGNVFEQFKNLMQSNSYTNKLSLMFTSYEPFISFFALSGLSEGPSASRFNTLPLHGSIMAFELFSYADSDTDVRQSQTFPPQSDLYVRFLFRNGTDEDEELTAYPLFGNSPSNTELQWYDFVDGMDEFAVQDAEEWCSVCATQNSICQQWKDTPATSDPQLTTKTSGKRLSPAVSGAIGGIVALGLAVLAFVALALLGFRLERNDRKPKASRSDLGVLRTSTGNGGYKGAEKLASDTDLRLKSGAGATVVRHERVGSWELNDGPRSPPPVYPNMNKDLESGRVRSQADYGRRSEDFEERIDPFGDPIKPIDQI